MTTDLGTTKRKPLTPTQRLKLFEDHKGICVVCGGKINFGEAWIDEHVRALGLAGTNDMDNRAPAHVKCAEAKTHNEDMPRITKAKAQKRAALGIKRDGPKLQSANTLRGPEKKRDKLPMPDRRPMFVD
jgi:5-methylcytosine-specific restriction endonuclease McrA